MTLTLPLLRLVGWKIYNPLSFFFLFFTLCPFNRIVLIFIRSNLRFVFLLSLYIFYFSSRNNYFILSFLNYCWSNRKGTDFCLKFRLSSTSSCLKFIFSISFCNWGNIFLVLSEGRLLSWLNKSLIFFHQFI